MPGDGYTSSEEEICTTYSTISCYILYFCILVNQKWDFDRSRRGRRDKKISQSGVNQPTTTSPTLKMAVSRWFFIKKQKKTKGCSYVDSSQFVGSFPEEKKEKSLLFTVRFKRHLCSIALVWHKWSYIMIIIVWKNVSYLTEESPLGHLTNGLRIGWKKKKKKNDILRPRILRGHPKNLLQGQFKTCEKHHLR